MVHSYELCIMNCYMYETLLESPSYHSRVKLGLYLAESFVMTSLLAQGFDIQNYLTLQRNKAEADFLISNKLAVTPIEVKSDRRISGKCFDEYDNSSFNDNLSKTLKVLKRFNIKSVFIC